MDYLTKEELLAVLSAAREKSISDWLMILIAFAHGMRATEVCDLRLADIDMEAKTIRVRRLKNSKETTQAMLEMDDEPLLNEFRGMILWRATKPTRVGKPSKNDRVFDIPYLTFYRRFREYAKHVGLPKSKQHPHSLKHTTANHMLHNGVGIKHVQQYLGHKRIDSTMRYLEVSDEQASEAARAAFTKAFA